MANRFPLILNTNSNQIQEIAATDTLDLTGSGLNLTGITTLSTSAQLNLGGGTNINTGTRGDILFYNASGTIQKLNLGASGKVLTSNGSDLVYGDSGSTANVYYVSTSGTDASGRGGSVDTAYRTIKYACGNITTPTATNPAIIFVKAGTYEEVQLPIVVPAFTTIAGDSLRATIIKPGSGLDSGGSIQNNRSTLFKMSNATVLQDVVMDGMGGYTPGSPNYKPEIATVGGVYLALNNASVVSTKSPYIYNCTSFGNGATGAVLDGSVHASGNRSMLFHTYTAVHSDGLGIWLKNNANAEMISTFTYYCTIGFSCTGGSKIRSLNSSNAYGEYGVYSAGFDSGESPNQGTVKGIMLTYVGVLGQSFQDGEQITGGTSSATAYVVNVQSEPKRMYVVSKSGTFAANETVTGGASGATATMAAASVETNQSGRILVTTFSSSADAGDSLQFASTDGNAYQIQSVSSVTANSVAYHVLVFSTSRATPVAENVTVNVRKEFSLMRLTGHDFLQVGTGGTDTTNWPNNPTQNPAQADQVVTNTTDPGRVYYTATDDLGNFYVGDQFKVDQATGNVTLDASAFNLSGLESLRLGSVGGLIGASINEFSTDGTMSQNSDTKVSTQKAVKTYVDTLNAITPSTGTFSLAGISSITGTTLFTKQLNVSGISTFHGNVNFLDGDRIRIGTSQDFQLYHDGNHSYIAENGSGDLKIQASAGSIFLQKSNGEEMIKATVDGPVELYFNDGKKIETTATGAIISGICTATTFSGTTANITGDIDVDGHTNLDNVSISGVCTASSFSGDGQNLTNTGSSLSEPSSGTHRLVTTSLTSGTMTSSGTDSVLSFNYSTHTLAATNFSGNGSSLTNLSAANLSGTAAAINGSNITNLPAANLTGTIAAISGANLTNLNGSNIASGTVPVARIGTGTKSTSTFYRGDGTFATVTAPAITGLSNASDNRILTSEGGTTVNSESNFTFNGTAAVISGGLKISGGTGNNTSTEDSTLYVTADNNNDWGLTIDKNRSSASEYALQIKVASNATYGIRLMGGGSDVFRVDGGGDIHSVGDIYPRSSDSYDLGSSSLRWRNIYTNDLNLSNEGSVNDVDGTWGDYTMQEGENDLFLINNRSGKKYKFNLTEVN